MGAPNSRKAIVTYSTLLLHLDDDTRAAIRLDEAMKLARRFNSRLIGVSCHRPAPWIGVAGSEFMGADPMTGELERAARAASTREAAFLRQCDVGGLASFEVATSDDEPARAIGERGFCADLILLGQADPADAGHARQRDIVDRVMEQTAAPVLVLPYAGRFATLGETVLIAWSNSREAARAVADAMPLLKQARAVHLVQFDPSVGESGRIDASRLEVVTRWLAAHGVQVQARVAFRRSDTGNALLSHAADVGADLLVMGAWSHSRHVERVLGGATRTVLDSMTVPVLMSH
jgi:nucleotide-binding universal stress UspA family protein